MHHPAREAKLAVRAHRLFLDVQPEIGEQSEKLLQCPYVLLTAADNSASRPIADDIVGDDGRDVFQIGRLPELRKELGRPTGGEHALEFGFALDRSRVNPRPRSVL